MAKRNNVRKKNSHQETPGAVALHFDGGTQRIYVVLDTQATIVAVIEEDRRGWGTLSDAGFSCPVYGPMQVEPMVVERLRNIPKRERESVGQIVAGLLGSPLNPYLEKTWGTGESPPLAHKAVETKYNSRYDAPLTANLGDRLNHIKHKLLK